MDLRALPKNSKVFIDSNIFTYHISGHSKFGKSCKKFLELVEDGGFEGYINDLVMSEVLLNFIKSELYKIKKIEPYRVTKEVKKDKELIDIIDFDKPVLMMESLKLEIVPSDFKSTEIAKVMKENKLLPNDAIHLLPMEKAQIENIATNDKDFERIKGIKVWKP